jgi:hypothetical protein
VCSQPPSNTGEALFAYTISGYGFTTELRAIHDSDRSAPGEESEISARSNMYLLAHDKPLQ